MKLSLPVIIFAVTIFCSPFGVIAAGASLSESQFDFRYYLRNKPMELDRLLGKHFTSVVPGETWQGLFVPEEYRNPSIRYAVFARGQQLLDYMKHWDFMTSDYCVSSESMFLLFFNRGYVFKVKLRYLPDTFRGTVRPEDPGYCKDETPIFEILSKKLGGAVTIDNGQRKLLHPESTYSIVLTTAGSATDLSWDLKGGPCTASTCPDE